MVLPTTPVPESLNRVIKKPKLSEVLREDPNFTLQALGLILLIVAGFVFETGFFSEVVEALWAPLAAGLGGTLYCLGSYFSRNRYHLLWGLGAILCLLATVNWGWSYLREARDQELAWALAQPSERDYAMELLQNPSLSHRPLLDVLELLPNGQAKFGKASRRFPYHVACERGDSEMLALILSHGPGRLLEDCKVTRGPLYTAVNIPGDPGLQCAELLLQAGVDPHHPEALYCILYKDRADMLEMFLRRGLTKDFKVRDERSMEVSQGVEFARAHKASGCLRILEK